MTKEIIETGKTVEEAIESGCEKLGLPREKVEFEILEMPKKGLLGLKTYPAKVRVYVQTGRDEEAAEYLSGILTAMGAKDFTIQPKLEGESLTLLLEGEDLGFVIGRRGETLDALQYITSLVINRLEGDYLRVTIDSGNFREKREKTLENLARRLCRNVSKSGRSVTLEPMNPYERRIIHATVSTIEGVTSSSIGEEPNRRVVISSTVPRKNPPRGKGGRSGGYRPRSGGADRGGDRRRDDRSGERRHRGENTRDESYRKDNSARPPRPRREEPRIPHREDTPRPVRDTVPDELSDFNAPLYGKIEL